MLEITASSNQQVLTKFKDEILVIPVVKWKQRVAEYTQNKLQDFNEEYNIGEVVQELQAKFKVTLFKSP